MVNLCAATCCPRVQSNVRLGRRSFLEHGSWHMKLTRLPPVVSVLSVNEFQVLDSPEHRQVLGGASWLACSLASV